MTNYVFDANPDENAVDWGSSSSWYGGIVPDSADAQVIIPTVTDTSDGDAYATIITIGSSESYAVQSVTIANNYLSLIGNLSMSGALDLQTGSQVDLAGGTLSFGSLGDDNGLLQGYGQIVATGTLDNTGTIGGIGNGTGLTINAATFHNTGLIGASGSGISTAPALALTIHAASDPDLVDGTLGGGGTYSAESGGILDLDLGGLITTDAATIEIDKYYGNGLTGQINSFDATTGTYLSLQSTLTTIAAPGHLVVENFDYVTPNAFRVDGELTLAETGTLTAPVSTIDPGGTVDGIGTVAGTIVNNGVIESENPIDDGYIAPQPGDLVLDGPISGTGTLEVGPGIVSYEDEINPPQRVVQRATLELAGPTAQNVLFADDTGILVLDDPASFSGTITAQFPAPDEDTVVLDGIALNDVTSYDYAGNTSGGILTIDEGQTSQTLAFAGDYTTASFLLSADAQPLSNSPPSLDISIACYARGTAIRTDRGNVPVEALRIGDRVATFTGHARPIRWIGRRAYSGRFLAANPAVQPILFKAGSLDRYQPRRDLRVSPKHAMFLHGCLVPAECLVNGVSVLRDTACAEVEYFHLELDSHDVILAEDAPSETFVDDNSRSMFHNLAEYQALYGDRPAAPALYCAPRIEHGETLDRIRRAIDHRTARTPAARTLHGRIDGWDGRVVRGWARDPDRPDVPACLEVLAGGRIVARTVANLFRDDLQRAGHGSGCHGFHLVLPDQPAGLSIEVRGAADAAILEVLQQHRAA